MRAGDAARAAAAVAAVALLGGSAAPAQIALRFGSTVRAYATAELLARPDVATIAIPADVSYRRAVRYRAVPLRNLLAGLPYERFEVVQVTAADGFVADVPTSLLKSKDGAIAWLAIDDPRDPWPKLPGKSYTAGPFYLVWEHPERSGVMSEQWVSNVAALTGTESPFRRWPQLDVPSTASAATRRGMNAYVTQCLPCHKFDGAGASTVGPDLGRPMNATAYMTPAGLHALVRDPASVRTWPQMKMGSFPPSALSGADLDALILYLKYKAATPSE